MQGKKVTTKATNPTRNNRSNKNKTKMPFSGFDLAIKTDKF
jgi:hypothetical protein